jgi:hypothetical protein
LLSRDPARVLSHWFGSRYPYNLPQVKAASTVLRKVLSLCCSHEMYGEIRMS